MFTASSRSVDAKVWENQEYGVLPIFCFNEQRSFGDEIGLHFFEPRYCRLLQIACETQLHCFIYANTGHPQIDTTAYICSINEIYRTDIRGVITNTVKINQSWIDMQDRLWWCRFQVVKINPIPPIIQTEFSSTFKCKKSLTNNSSIPVLMFFNNNIPTEDKFCELYYNPLDEVKMYSSMCTSTMKQAIISAATNASDPEYKSLCRLTEGTIWYLLPEHSQKGVDCGTIVKYVEETMNEVTGSTTGNDLISMLVDLEVSSVRKILIRDSKADIMFGDDHTIRCPMSREANTGCFLAQVDFGITRGNFSPAEVSLTPSASKRIFKQISMKVNEDRLGLLKIGHHCSNCLLKKLPTPILEKIKSFLIYM